MNSYFILSFIEGILAFISPCILPLLPVYFFYLAGVSTEKEMGEGANRRKLIVNSLGFVLGFTMVFVSMGATATVFGQFLKGNIGVFQKVSGAVMIVFGLHFLGVFRLKFLDIERRIEYNFGRLGFFTSIIFGIVFSLGWTPCTGPMLGSALLMAGNSKTLTEGILLLLTYSAGLGLPFVLSAMIFLQLKETFRQIQRVSRIISVVSGIVLIISGILLLNNKLGYLDFRGILNYIKF